LYLSLLKILIFLITLLKGIPSKTSACDANIKLPSCTSGKNNSLRPKSVIDPKYNTIYEYNELLSNINKSVWINSEKTIFGKKIIIISYRGTGLYIDKRRRDSDFLALGNRKRDLGLDRKIMFGKITQDKEVKHLIKDFDSIYKKYGKTYKYYLTGHSLGGRLAFEIHRKRPNKIKECHIFNAGFGLDIKYLHDIINSQQRDYNCEKNTLQLSHLR